MESRILLKALFSAILLSTSSITTASEYESQQPDRNQPFFTAGLTAGGDTLAERTDGTELTAGGLFYGGIGLNIQLTQRFDIRTVFGYHFDFLDSSTGSADFDRFYFEVLPVIHLTDKARIGIGMLHIISAEYSDPFGSMELDNATGLLMEWSYELSSSLSWGIRYSDIEYTVKTIDGFNVELFNLKVDGGYLGVSVYLSL